MASKARRADVELRLLNRRYKRDLKRAQRDTQGFAKRAKASLISGFKGGFGALAAFGTAGGLAEAGQDVFAFEESLKRLDIQAKGAADIAALRKEGDRLRDTLGLSKTESLKAATELTNLLGAASATDAKMNLLSNVMVGTGAEMKALAGLAQIFDQQFDLKSPEQLAAGFSSMIAIGKKGSVPLKAMAAVGKQSAAVFARVGDDGARGVQQLAAALQIAEQSFGTPAEGATGLKAFVEGLAEATQKVPSLRKAIGQVDTESFKGLDNALDQLAKSKFFTDPRRFRRAFPTAAARTMIRALIEGRKSFDDFVATGEGGVKQQAAFADATNFATSDIGRMKIAMAKLKGEVAAVFTPERIAIMVDIAEGLGVALGFVIDNWKMFLVGFLAIKAVRIGSSLASWSRSARGLAVGLEQVAASGDSAGSSLGRAAKKGGRFAKIASAIGPALALTVGFEAGQALGGAVVAGKRQRFAAGQQRQQKALSRNERVSLAAQQLASADVVTEAGRLRPEFEASLQQTVAIGGPLTALQRQALVALQGFEEIEKATSSLAAGLIEELKRKEGIGPKIRQVVTGGISPDVAKGALSAERNQVVIQQIAALGDAVKAVQAAVERPIEVKVMMDSDVVARANESARAKNRRPAP